MNALAASKLWAARCYDSSLANHMARSWLPTKFSGFMSNVASFKANQIERGHIFTISFSLRKVRMVMPTYDVLTQM